MLPMGAPGSGGSPAWIQGQTFSRTVLGITALPVYYPPMATFLGRLESRGVCAYVPLHAAMNERRSSGQPHALMKDLRARESRSPRRERFDQSQSWRSEFVEDNCGQLHSRIEPPLPCP